VVRLASVLATGIGIPAGVPAVVVPACSVVPAAAGDFELVSRVTGWWAFGNAEGAKGSDAARGSLMGFTGNGFSNPLEGSCVTRALSVATAGDALTSAVNLAGL
jgi:hypothetical protein